MGALTTGTETGNDPALPRVLEVDELVNELDEEPVLPKGMIGAAGATGATTIVGDPPLKPLLMTELELDELVKDEVEPVFPVVPVETGATGPIGPVGNMATGETLLGEDPKLFWEPEAEFCMD